MCVSALCVPGVHGGQKGVLGSPKLELQRAVNHMSAGNQTQDPCRATSALNQSKHSSPWLFGLLWIIICGLSRECVSLLFTYLGNGISFI